MRYFVTGATGFVGSRVVHQLVDGGHDVVVLVRTPATATTLPDEVAVVRGDVTDRESMRDAMAGADGVFHIAGWYRIGVDDHETAYRVNVEGTRNVLELMRDLDVPKGVYTSTVAVNSDTGGLCADESYRYDGTHLSAYDRTKWLAHYEVAEPMIEAGLPLVIVMPGAVYGPGDRGPTRRLWKSYLRGESPVIPTGSGYCWGHVDDTATAHRRAMVDGEPGESYVIAGEPYTLVDVFDLAEQLTGIEAPRSISPVIFRALSRLVAPFERVITTRPEYSSESLRVLGGVTYWADNSKAKRELDLDHRPFPSGLRETLRHELEHWEDRTGPVPPWPDIGRRVLSTDDTCPRSYTSGPLSPPVRELRNKSRYRPVSSAQMFMLTRVSWVDIRFSGGRRSSNGSREYVNGSRRGHQRARKAAG